VATTESTEPRPQESALHEPSSIPLRSLLKFTIWFVVGIVIVELVTWWAVFVPFRAAAAQERQVTGVDEPRIAPPAPQLEPSLDHNRLPGEDLVALRAHEAAELKRRGLLDENGQPTFPPGLLEKIAK